MKVDFEILEPFLNAVIGLENGSKEVEVLLSGIDDAYSLKALGRNAERDFTFDQAPENLEIEHLEIDLHTYLTCEPNLVSIRRHFLDCFSSSLRGMPGEESAILNNSANDIVFLSDGESLPGDLSDLNFTNPEFADNVQADDLFSFQAFSLSGD